MHAGVKEVIYYVYACRHMLHTVCQRLLPQQKATTDGATEKSPRHKATFLLNPSTNQPTMSSSITMTTNYIIICHYCNEY